MAEFLSKEGARQAGRSAAPAAAPDHAGRSAMRQDRLPAGQGLSFRVPVQRAAASGAEDSPARIHQAAGEGILTPSGALPYADRIQRSFGRHDVSSVRAHLGAAATRSAHAMNAAAYATGSHVVFAGAPDLRTVAHEAAHVVQQRAGVQLLGGVGQVGDPYERHADAVAELVVAGRSAEALLDRFAGSADSDASTSSAGPVQRQIVLTDSAQSHYEEQDATKPAYGKGPLYWTGKYKGEAPIFTPAAPVDTFREGFGLNDASLSDLRYKRKLAAAQGGPGLVQLNTAAAAWQFYTDTAEITNAMGAVLKEGAAQQVLQMPLLRDPNRKGGGFANRFPLATGGQLYSKLSKEETEQKLGELPQGVTLHEKVADNLFLTAKAQAVNPEDVTKDFVYNRAQAGAINPRDAASTFKTKSTVDTKNDDEALEQLKTVPANEVPPPQGDTRDEAVYKAFARKVSRGKGQADAMNGWNALAYAAYANVKLGQNVQLGQDWEWLHIRGSQNGGPTTAANLVAGTSTTNSRMIPWEDQINDWTSHASSQRPLHVTYEGTRYANSNLGKNIKFTVWAPQGLKDDALPPIAQAQALVVEFDPIEGRVFDRMSKRLAEKVAMAEKAKTQGEATATAKALAAVVQQPAQNVALPQPKKGGKKRKDASGDDTPVTKKQKETHPTSSLDMEDDSE